MHDGWQSPTAGDEAKESTAILVGELLEDFPEIFHSLVVFAHLLQHD